MLLRDGTQDFQVFQEVYFGNEYNLPNEFLESDVIVDIGAQIGSFALACLHRGAGRVLCFEPDPDNFQVLLKNMDRYEGKVECFRAAVWRSDRSENLNLRRPGNQNLTAMTQVSPGKTTGYHVTTYSLDWVLRNLERVRLLKLDCEGSEYPVLYTAKELGRVHEIVGESHEQIPHPDFPGRCNNEGVVRFLQEQGFEAVGIPNLSPERAPYINNFRGTRP